MRQAAACTWPSWPSWPLTRGSGRYSNQAACCGRLTPYQRAGYRLAEILEPRYPRPGRDTRPSSSEILATRRLVVTWSTWPRYSRPGRLIPPGRPGQAGHLVTAWRAPSRWRSWCTRRRPRAAAPGRRAAGRGARARVFGPGNVSECSRGEGHGTPAVWLAQASARFHTVNQLLNSFGLPRKGPLISKT
jgi:hypothetical protein